MVAEAPAGDDATAVVKELTPYFHGFIVKQKAIEALTGMAPATFLIRAYTEVSVNSFVLSMLCRGQVRHHFIARPKQGECFAVNKSPTECTTLTDVIKFLREKRTFWPVPLQQGLKPAAPITTWPPEKMEFDTKAAAMEKLIQKYMVKPELNKDMAVRGALNKWRRTASGAQEEDQPLYAKPKAVLDEAAAKEAAAKEAAAKEAEEKEQQASGDEKKDKKKKGSKKDKEDKKQAKSSKRGSKKDKSKKGEKGGAEEAATEKTQATETTGADAEGKAEAEPSVSADDAEASSSKRGSKKEKRGSKKGLSRWFSSSAECQAAEDAGITEEDILASLAEFDEDDLADPDIYGFPEDMDN